LPPEDKRKIVEAIIEKIVIGNGEIDITFSHLPSSEELCKSQQRLDAGRGKIKNDTRREIEASGSDLAARASLALLTVAGC
jgi:hypothetical protein